METGIGRSDEARSSSWVRGGKRSLEGSGAACFCQLLARFGRSIPNAARKGLLNAHLF